MPENEVQLDLFNGDVKTKSVLKAVDSLNDKFGDLTITWGSSLKTAGARGNSLHGSPAEYGTPI